MSGGRRTKGVRGAPLRGTLVAAPNGPLIACGYELDAPYENKFLALRWRCAYPMHRGKRQLRRTTTEPQQ